MNSTLPFLDGSVTGFYLGVAILAIVPAILATWILPKRYREGRAWIFFYFWLLNLSIPFAGIPITLWLVHYLMTVRHRPQVRGAHFIDMNEFSDTFPEIHRQFGEASMPFILSSPQVPDRVKMKALVSLSERAGGNEISLIKRSLADRNDEIRLYSFSVINRLENEINEAIYRKIRRFRQLEEGKVRARLAGEIALLYWDLIDLELADRDLVGFFAQEVDRYGSEALRYDPDNVEYRILLGRCRMRVGDFQGAERYLAPLETKGVDETVLPLAELYFHRREFSRIRELVANAEEQIHESVSVYPLAQLWRRERG